MDATASSDVRCRRVRRSRVVPAPRCWRQVCRAGDVGPIGPDTLRSTSDGGKKARSPRRARRKSSRPSRREGRLLPPVPVVSALAQISFARGPRVHAATRSSLRPPNSRGCVSQKTRAPSRRGNTCRRRLCRLSKAVFGNVWEFAHHVVFGGIYKSGRSAPPMVNRVLTSPYLWWFDPLPAGLIARSAASRVLAWL